MITKRLQKNIAVMLIGIMSYGGGSVVFAYDDIAVRAAVAADEADEVHMPAHPEEAVSPDEADEVHMPAHPEEAMPPDEADEVHMPADTRRAASIPLQLRVPSSARSSQKTPKYERFLPC